jgi:hypothetical protein
MELLGWLLLILPTPADVRQSTLPGGLGKVTKPQAETGCVGHICGKVSCFYADMNKQRKQPTPVVLLIFFYSHLTTLFHCLAMIRVMCKVMANEPFDRR